VGEKDEIRPEWFNIDFEPKIVSLRKISPSEIADGIFSIDQKRRLKEITGEYRLKHSVYAVRYTSTYRGEIGQEDPNNGFSYIFLPQGMTAETREGKLVVLKDNVETTDFRSMLDFRGGTGSWGSPNYTILSNCSTQTEIVNLHNLVIIPQASRLVCQKMFIMRSFVNKHSKDLKKVCMEGQ